MGSHIDRERAREEKRRRGEEEEGSWEGERNGFSPVLYHKERERKKKDDRGEMSSGLSLGSSYSLSRRRSPQRVRLRSDSLDYPVE